MQFKNFMVPLGIGLVLFVGSMIAMSWEYNYTVPYIYCTLHYLQEGSDTFSSKYNIHLLAGIYFIAFTAISYFLYIFKKEKG
ncbi:MAG: hypothetical protein H7Y00_05745 [Fimbriimonadaceae bacterium]|nr:hypothetical protein [Chitinophagales bacterium]